ncbi:hypothetical protein F383_34822 [Gossypium arboreum]|uniref:Uncharacterized protein n=2 Tax=Gossypium arboreum TaxID=29729 RepID=A0A0B0PNP1_GOSAR|nr:hypothetical protein F383_34822 [Gossypium arboreum]
MPSGLSPDISLAQSAFGS